jgi:putative tail protein
MATPVYHYQDSGGGGNANSDSFTHSLGSAGDVCFVTFQSSHQFGIQPQISDTNDNTWNPVALWDSGGIWYATLTSSASSTVTVNIPGASSSYLNSYSYCFSCTGVITGGVTASFSFGTATGVGSAITGALTPQIPAYFEFTAGPFGNWYLTMLSVSGSSGNPLVLSVVAAPTSSSAKLSLPSSWGNVVTTLLDSILVATYTFPSQSLGQYTANDIISDICVRAGLSQTQIDVNLLTDQNVFGGSTTVLGYVIGSQTSAADILKPLLQAYFIDAVETRGQLKFVPRGGAPVILIEEGELGLVSDKAKVKPETIKQAQDLPLTVNVVFSDIALNYQQNNQQRTRNSAVVTTRQRVTMSIPLVMTTTQAIQIADAWLYVMWLERQGFTMSLGSPKYMVLDPTDVIQFVYEGNTFEMRITEDHIGQGYAAILTGINNDNDGFDSTASGSQSTGSLAGSGTGAGSGTSTGAGGGGSSGGGSGGTRIISPTSLYLLDIALIVDTDSNSTGGTGFYGGMGSSLASWPGAALQSSLDDINFSQIGSVSTTNLIFGGALNALAAPTTLFVFDSVSTLNVSLVNGSLSGVSLQAMLNGANVFIVGNEIIAAMNTVQNSDGSWTLSGLLRGLRGTEQYCASHQIGETVILASYLSRYADPLSAIQVTEYYQAVTVGADPSAASAQAFTIAGNDLKPYAPCQVGGTADGSGNITITWNRRTRIGGEADWNDGVASVPLSEDSESYSVDILNGTSVVRTLTATAATVVYTVAQQTTDFGSPQSAVTVKVYQISGEVGRGYAGTGVVPTPGGWPVPVAPTYASSSGGSGGGFYVNGG